MSGIRFDGSTKCVSVTTPTAGCNGAPGVTELRVGQSRLRGVVTMAGSVSSAGQTIFVTGGSNGASRVSELTDVIATDPLDGSLLRYDNNQNSPFYGYWVASRVLDGGGYA